MAGEKKISKLAGHDGKVKERKRGLCHITCGSVVLAKRGDYLDDFEGGCEDNSIKGWYAQSDEVSILFHGFFTIRRFLERFRAVVRHLG